MKAYDVVVVGAGPAGGHTARIIAEKGFEILLLEEHDEIGKPVQCAGLVTPRVFDLLGFEAGSINTVRGAEIFSPSFKKLTIDAGRTKAHVINRKEFDQAIANRAVESNCQLILGAKFLDTQRNDNEMNVSFRLNNKIETVHSKLLIGADGARSNVASKLHFPMVKEVLKGYGSNDASASNINPDFVKIFSGNEIAPGFFAWLIPADDHARVGLCTSRGDKSPKHYFERLLKNPQFKKIAGDIKCRSYTAGIIPISKIAKAYKDNVMLVGDAAAQVKPLSGGGIYTGLKGAIHCANAALKALESEDFSEEVLKEYQNNWDEDLGKELKRAYLIRRIVRDLSDEQIEEGFEIFSDGKLLSLINKKGDIDYPTKLALPVLQKAPKLMKFTGPVLKSLF